MKLNDPRLDTLKFIAIAVVLMVLTDHFIFGGKRDYIENARQEYYSRQMIEEEVKEIEPPVVVQPEDGAEYFEQVPEPAPVPEDEPAPTPAPVVSVPEPAPVPYEGKARIAIVIDDLGMDVKRSRKIIELKAPITLAFLPYAPKTAELAKAGKESGHSLIIHAPMEATDVSQNIGPIGLRSSMDRETFDKNFGDMLASFEGYEGINNHMGSRLTQDAEAMTHLMELLRNHNLFFVDSRTINTSVAAQKAKEAGIPYAVRDVFLDNQNTIEFVRQALAQTERIAKRRGSAIAIGHPRDATIEGLREWIPTLAAKGIEIVPVRELLITPSGVIPSVVEESHATKPDPSATLRSGRDDIAEEDKSTVSVTLPDGTEQLIHLPPQQSPSPY